MSDAAERQHLRAVLCRRDMTDMFAFGPHRRRFRAEMPVGVDLHLDAAITENSLRDDRYRIHSFIIARDDERGRFVIRISRPCADPGDEDVRAGNRIAVPFGLLF